MENKMVPLVFEPRQVARASVSVMKRLIFTFDYFQRQEFTLARQQFLPFLSMPQTSDS